MTPFRPHGKGTLAEASLQSFVIEQASSVGLLGLVGFAYAAWFRQHRAAMGFVLLLWLALGLGATPLAKLSELSLAHDLTPTVSGWLPWNLLLVASLPSFTVASRAFFAVIVVLLLQLGIPLMIDPATLATMPSFSERIGALAPGNLSRWLAPLPQLVVLAAAFVFFLRWQKSDQLTELALCLMGSLMLLGVLRPDWLFWCVVGAMALLMLGVFITTHRMAFIDPLTHQYNRRALDYTLTHLSRKRQFAIGMLDIDHFKRINDRFGHDFGDHVLRMVAARIRSARGARVYRYGGEEFCLLFKGRSLREAVLRCNVVREAVAARPIAMRSPRRPAHKPLKKSAFREKVPSVKVTVSIGLAHSTEADADPAAVIEKADKNLYKAKKNGRNQVVSGRIRKS